MEPKICPRCGTPQQWEIWRRCLCGHDFGPPSQAAPPVQTRKKTAIDIPWAPPSRADLGLALLLATIGCALLLSAVWDLTIAPRLAGIAVIWSFMFLPGPPVHRPIRWLDWLIGLGILAAIAAILVLGRRFRHLDQHPAFAITVWMVLMIVLHGRWRWLRRKSAPNIGAKVT